jgi:hypothetical protein
MPHCDVGWNKNILTLTSTSIASVRSDHDPPVMCQLLGSVNGSVSVPKTALPTFLLVLDCVLVDNVLANNFKSGAVTKINQNVFP